MASTRTPQTTGFAVVVVGLLTFTISTQISGGFFRGLFQGMTIALMAAGAYLLGTPWRRGRGSRRADEEGSEEMWLPSQDEQR